MRAMEAQGATTTPHCVSGRLGYGLAPRGRLGVKRVLGLRFVPLVTRAESREKLVQDPEW